MDAGVRWVCRLRRLITFKHQFAFNHSLTPFTPKVACANYRVFSPIHLSEQRVLEFLIKDFKRWKCGNVAKMGSVCFQGTANAPFPQEIARILAAQTGPIRVVMGGKPSPWASGKTLAMNDGGAPPPASFQIHGPQSHGRVLERKQRFPHHFKTHFP